MKMHDPESVIRESEFATAENTGSVPERVWALYNKMLKGTRLTQSQRNKMFATSKKIFSADTRQYKDAQKQYRTIAKRMKIDPLNAVPDFELIKEPPGQKAIEFMQQNANNPIVQKQFIRKYGEQNFMDTMGNQGRQQ